MEEPGTGEALPTRKPPEGENPKTEISSDILSSLGLTPADVKEFDKEEIERKKLIKEQRGRGAIMYGDLRRGMPFDRVSITMQGLGDMYIKATRFEEIPDAIMNEWENQKKEAPRLQEKESKASLQIKACLEGFGGNALEGGDWKTAVNAFDIATGGRVMDNPELMSKLKGIASGDKPTGVEIAKTIQTRIDKRTAQNPQPPEQPPTA